MENRAIPFGSLNRCPLFWPKVHRFGHLSLEGGTRKLTRVRNPSQIVTPLALRAWIQRFGQITPPARNPYCGPHPVFSGVPQGLAAA